MESIDALDLLNVGIGLFAVLGAIVYSIIKTKVDVDHMKSQITSLFDLWNNRDK
tara:strand:+ start:679 stop:840 length:162 start_codon:yes stop_codon:yes gene_type:complete